MKSPTRFASLLALLLIAAIGSAYACPKPKPVPFAKPLPITATIFGHFASPAEGGPAWAGHALVKFGTKPAQTTTIADHSDGPPTMRDDGSFLGIETITVTFDDGSGSFEIDCAFEAIPASTPGLYMLHETGTLGNGTGDYATISGSVVIKGPFLIPDPALNPAVLNPSSPPLWIAQLHGRALGLDGP